MTRFRVFGASLVVMGILVGVISYFNTCEQEGKLLSLANGRQIPMKCTWTARAEIAVGTPIVLMGGMLAFAGRKETRRVLGILGVALGALVMMLPTNLIGVCTTMTASCNQVMRPAMLVLGGLIIAASLTTLGLSEFRRDSAI